jgi:hypothetical protein
VEVTTYLEVRQVKLADMRLEQIIAWLQSAPRQFLIQELQELLNMDLNRFGPLLKKRWEEFLALPDNRQHQEILEGVADILQRHFQLSPAVATRLAEELIRWHSDEANDLSSKTRMALPLADWKRVRDTVLAVDVTYQTSSPDSRSKWKRQLCVYLKEDTGSVRSISQETELRWEDLPKDVREACTRDNQTQQRFGLYRGETPTS